VYEKVIHNTEELNAMAAHLRTSQNFHELKALAAQWLVPEQDVEDFISGKRFQLAEIPMSEKEYASAPEKLREEMWLLRDQLFTDIVTRHLIQKAEGDMLFSCQVLKKQKSLQKCMNYIMEQAYKIAEKEYEKRFGEKPDAGRRTQNRTISMGLAETKVYQWAEEYYALDDAAKEAKEQAAEKKKRLKSLKKEERRKNAESLKKESSEKTSAIEQDSPGISEKAKKDAEKQNPKNSQLSLFDLKPDMGQEKMAEGGEQ